MSASVQRRTELTINVRYYCRQTVLPKDPVPARGFRGHVEKPLLLRADDTVIACMHVLNVGFPGGIDWSEGSPAWQTYSAVESVPRMKEIVEEHLAPLIEAAHRVGIRVIHLLSGVESSKNYPQWREIASRVEEDEKPALPVGPNRDWRQEFLTDVFGPGFAHGSNELESLLDVAPPVKPTPEDWVVTTTQQATTLLSENGIGNILYTGFDTGGCLMISPGGLRPMAGPLKYRPIVLRDCTTNGETAETVENLEITKASLYQIEMFRGYTALGAHVREVLNRL